MRLADDIAVMIGSKTITLRPSLRAATRLERTYGFEKLLSGIAEGNVGTLSSVVSANGADLLYALEGVSLSEVMPDLIDAASRHVLALTGFDPDGPKQAKAGERTTFAEYHAKLYRIATGWLGWSPEQAWNATPAEILEAYSGHLEMLRALHGSAEAEQSNSCSPDDAVLDRKGLHGLKALSGTV